MPEWLLLAVTVLTAAGEPVKGAWVECDQMWKSAYWEEQTTDSRGRFVVIVPPGPHPCSATKDARLVRFVLDGQDVDVTFLPLLNVGPPHPPVAHTDDNTSLACVPQGIGTDSAETIHGRLDSERGVRSGVESRACV